MAAGSMRPKRLWDLSRVKGFLTFRHLHRYLPGFRNFGGSKGSVLAIKLPLRDGKVVSCQFRDSELKIFREVGQVGNLRGTL